MSKLGSAFHNNYLIDYVKCAHRPIEITTTMFPFQTQSIEKGIDQRKLRHRRICRMDTTDNRNRRIRCFQRHIAYSNSTSICTRIYLIFSPIQVLSKSNSLSRNNLHLRVSGRQTMQKMPRRHTGVGRCRICRPISRAFLMWRIHVMTQFQCRVLVTVAKLPLTSKHRKQRLLLNFYP